MNLIKSALKLWRMSFAITLSGHCREEAMNIAWALRNERRGEKRKRVERRKDERRRE